MPHYKGVTQIASFLFPEDVMKKTAILVDGGFYRSVAYRVFGDTDPKTRASELENYCKKHITQSNEDRELYRIFYYDCMPS